MTELTDLIFRQITPADFFNINKPPGTEDGGGGQSYIDVPVRNVGLDKWYSFFANVKPVEKASGPLWKIEINSLGGLGKQKVEIGQRRNASVNIRSQKLLSRMSNRVFAWHPDLSGFPRAPARMSSAEDPGVIKLTEGLIIFLLKTKQGEYWAGWFRIDEIQSLIAIDPQFKAMLSEPAGHLSFDPHVELDVTSLKNPFSPLPNTAPKVKAGAGTQNQKPKKKILYNATTNRTEEEIAAEFFKDDSSSEEVKKNQKVVETFERNHKAVRDLKRLYNTCQVTGNEFVFSKINGEPYLEVHHLVPLGEGGSDEPANLVVISAHIHRMLHYAVVKGVDLSKIVDNKLDFTINEKNFTITWRPEHAKVISDTGGA